MRIGDVNQIMQNLILYYNFDRIENNKVQNVVNPSENEATAVNVQQVEGVSGTAVYLSGEDFTPELSYVGLENPQLNITDSMTVSVWALPIDHNNWDVIIEKARPSAPTRNEFMIGLIEGKVQYEIMDNDEYEGNVAPGRTGRYGSANDYLGKWTNFTLVYDNSERIASLYINGEKVSSINVAEPLNVLPDSGHLIIGADIDNGATYGANSPVGASDRFHGYIDEVRIYNEALDKGKIAILYNKYVPVTYPSDLEERSSVDVDDSNTVNNAVFGKNGNVSYAVWKDPDVNQLWIDLQTSESLPVRIKAGDTVIDTVVDGRNRIYLEDVSSGTVNVVIEPNEPNRGGVIEPNRGIAEIEKRSIIGYSTKTIRFGDTASTTVKIPVLDITQKVNLNFGKYERLMPNGTTVIATVPATVESQGVSPTAQPTTETINIENPGKPVKPNKADFINPETGKLDKAAYNAAKAEYKKALASYKTALKTYKAAVKAAKLEAKGEKKSLKIEQKAIKNVKKALAKLIKGEKKVSKYATKAEVSLEKATNYRSRAEQLRAEANERATTLLGNNWTMDDLKEALVKPKKSDFKDETGAFDKEAYKAAVARYKEAKAIYKLFKKADKYEVKATKLETKAEIYQKKAVDISAKTVDKFESTLEKLVNKYTAKAESLRAKGESLLAQAENLTGINYYKAVGKGLYSVELAEGYSRGAEIATAVLETYTDIDVTANPGVAESLENVDISNVNVSI
jgi:hypothetical protein